MSHVEPSAAPQLDLSSCAQEPIHIPGSIQPHGILIALAPETLKIRQISANAAKWLGAGDGTPLVDRTLRELLGPEAEDALVPALRNPAAERNPLYAGPLTLPPSGSEKFQCIVHRMASSLILELESAQHGDLTFNAVYPIIHGALNAISDSGSAAELYARAVREFRRLTGFDRVLAYRFDKTWNGHVVAEDKDPDLPSYLDLCFPASDIPEQARELYRLNRLRQIVDVNYEPVPLLRADDAGGEPLDLTFSVLRSVSPIHIEYMKNMGVAASMSISIVQDGRLWGLISCHHRTPRTVPFEVRTACDLLGQAFAIKSSAIEHAVDYERRIHLKAIVTRLLAAMTQHTDFIDGLTANPDDVLSLAGADGAAILFGGRCSLLGVTPPEEQVLSIADWILDEGRAEVFDTDCLPDMIPHGEHLRSRASGLLAISISELHRSFVLWFRREAIQTITWGGDPKKPALASESGMRLHPRKSFEAWRETVRGHSLPWRRAEIDTAAEFRHAMISIVLRNAEEMAGLSAELQRSNKELEAFSYSVSHDLRAPFRHIMGFAELLREHLGNDIDPKTSRYLTTVIDSAQSAGMMVDHLLNYSRIGRAKLYCTRVDMTGLVREAIREAELDSKSRKIEWSVDHLPAVHADVTLMRVVLSNLLSNAVKYSRGRETPKIEIGVSDQGKDFVFHVRDNGVGFDQRFVDKLFGVFQRLHREEEFEGSGIGLANVRRIVARHGGRTWAEGVVGKGATFFFSLPKQVNSL